VTEPKEVDPAEVISLAGKILEIAQREMACSPEVLVAVLKAAASAVEETKFANVAASLRANLILQSRGRR